MPNDLAIVVVTATARILSTPSTNETTQPNDEELKLQTRHGLATTTAPMWSRTTRVARVREAIVLLEEAAVRGTIVRPTIVARVPTTVVARVPTTVVTKVPTTVVTRVATTVRVVVVPEIVTGTIVVVPTAIVHASKHTCICFSLIYIIIYSQPCK